MIMPVLLTDRRPGQAHRAYWACPVSTNQAMMGGVEVFRFPRRCPQLSPEPHRLRACCTWYVAHNTSNFFPRCHCPR